MGESVGVCWSGVELTDGALWPGRRGQARGRSGVNQAECVERESFSSHLLDLCPEKNYFKNGSPENDTNNYHLLRILWETL